MPKEKKNVGRIVLHPIHLFPVPTRVGPALGTGLVMRYPAYNIAFLFSPGLYGLIG
jgi:hypothetical protein